MTKLSAGILSLLVGVLVFTSPVAAKSSKTQSTSCKQIRSAIASGKSADEVASQYNVSATRVSQCTKPMAKKTGHSHTTAKQQ